MSKSWKQKYYELLRQTESAGEFPSPRFEVGTLRRLSLERAFNNPSRMHGNTIVDRHAECGRFFMRNIDQPYPCCTPQDHYMDSVPAPPEHSFHDLEASPIPRMRLRTWRRDKVTVPGQGVLWTWTLRDARHPAPTVPTARSP